MIVRLTKNSDGFQMDRDPDVTMTSRPHDVTPPPSNSLDDRFHYRDEGSSRLLRGNGVDWLTDG